MRRNARVLKIWSHEGQIWGLTRECVEVASHYHRKGANSRTLQQLISLSGSHERRKGIEVRGDEPEAFPTNFCINRRPTAQDEDVSPQQVETRIDQKVLLLG